MEGSYAGHHTSNAGQTEGSIEEAYVFYNVIEMQHHC